MSFDNDDETQDLPCDFCGEIGRCKEGCICDDSGGSWIEDIAKAEGRKA
jgi:hypothetical protein